MRPPLSSSSALLLEAHLVRLGVVVQLGPFVYSGGQIS